MAGETTGGMAEAEKGPDEPPLPSAYDLEAIRANVNDAAAVSGGLWVSFLFVMFYLMVGAGAVTHLDLFLEKPIRLPFLSLDLPLVAFFCLAPALFLIVHAYTLIHFVILAEKAKGFHQALSESDRLRGANPSDDWRKRPDNLRRRLPNNVFVQFLAGPPEIRTGLFGLMLRAISWISLAIGPILLLLLIQIQFLPYQSLAITWEHRAALAIDFVLLWWLWRKILSGRHVGSRRQLAPRGAAARGSMAAGGLLTCVVLLFSLLILAFEDEAQTAGPSWARLFPDGGNPKSRLTLHGYLFQFSIDRVSRKRNLPLANTLILTNVNLLDALGVDDAAKLQNRDYLLRVRGRNFRGAVFDRAILPKIDFFGAKLEGASFAGAVLDQANFDQSDLRNAGIGGATARGASFDHANLERAALTGSNLAGADFSAASLADASFYSTDLSGAKFNGSRLTNADFRSSVLFGASFACADLSGANLSASEVTGAFFTAAKLDGAELSDARIDASDFSDARLSHVSAPSAEFSRLYFGSALRGDLDEGLKSQFERAKLDEASFAEQQIAVFKENLCGLNADGGFVLAADPLRSLSAASAAVLAGHLLSPDCAISASLTAKERDRLRAKLQVGRPASRAGSSRDCPAP